MRYVMREKLFSWGDDFTIQDGNGQDVYFVDGEGFSWGKKLSFQDMHGNELLFIRQEVFAWGPTFEITRGGQLVATVKKELFTRFSCRFMVDVPGPDDLEAKGDFIHHEYEFTRHDGVIAQVSKQWFSWSDTYGVEIGPGEDDVLILAATVVIDAACHPDNKH